MKARILPLGDLAEYGKQNSVALLMTMTRPEAQQMLDQLEAWTQEDYEAAKQERSTPVKLLIGYLEVIVGGNPKPDEYNQDAVNTDGRSTLSRSIPSHPIQVVIPDHNAPNINPNVLAARVAEEMGTHGPNCNCEWHRVSRGGR